MSACISVPMFVLCIPITETKDNSNIKEMIRTLFLEDKFEAVFN